MNIAIRRMIACDIDAVVDVEQQSFSLPWSREAFVMEINKNELSYYLVMLDGKKVIGYAGMWIIVDEAHVTNIAILPEYHGRGLGKQLVNDLIQKARNRGAQRMTLEVRQTNEIAKRLYAGLGFVEAGIRRCYYTDTQEDAIVMWHNAIASEPIAKEP